MIEMGGITRLIFTSIFANEVGLIHIQVTTFRFLILALVLIAVFFFIWRFLVVR